MFDLDYRIFVYLIDEMNHPSIIDTVHLFPKLDQELNSLLVSLTPDDWEKQTLASKWKVKDVAAHLLDGNIRAISILRDQYSMQGPDPISSYRDLVNYLDSLNAEWVLAMKRMSPELIVYLLELTGKLYCDVMSRQDLQAKAIYAVSWAGEEESVNWFHIAREYTEKWHHQQQIRYAVGATGVLFEAVYYGPFLETCTRALPHHYRDVAAPEESCIRFNIPGSERGSWYLHRKSDLWNLSYQCKGQCDCVVEIPGEIAWRIFTKGISREEAEKNTRIKGLKDLGIPILNMLSVMA